MNQPGNNANDRQDKADRLVSDIMARRSRGEDVDIDAVIQDHPELEPELSVALRAVEETTAKTDESCLIERGRAQANAALDSDDWTTASTETTPGKSTIKIDGYEVFGEIHRGGQGVVYRGVQDSTKAKVAIKVLLQGPFASDSARKRFGREIGLIAQLKHPNIIRVIDSGTTDAGYMYCVMEYVRGQTLSRYLQEERVPVDKALQLFIQICDAVQYAHQRGVIHRDIKPSNVLIDSDGVPHVLDFGLAKQLASPSDPAVSVTGQFIGTLPYMSPEQATGNPDNIDARTDVYSLGVMMYEMLTGEYPYPVVGKMIDVLQHIQRTPPAPPSRSWSMDSGVLPASTRRSNKRCPIDDDIQTLVLTALEKNPARRYQSAGSLAENIRRYLRHEPIEPKRERLGYVLWLKLKYHHRRFLTLTACIIVAISVALAWFQHARMSRLRNIDAALLVGSQAQNWMITPLAEQSYQEVLELAPHHEKACYGLAVIHKDQGMRESSEKVRQDEFATALAYADRSLAANPNDANLLNVKAVLLLEQGEYEAALEAARRAIDHHTLPLATPNLYSVYAKALALVGQVDEALDAVKTGIARIQWIPEKLANDKLTFESLINNRWYAGVWRTRGVLEFALGDADALPSLDQAVACNTGDPRSRLVRAKVRLMSGDLDGARSEMAKTINMKDGASLPWAQETLAWIAYESGEYAKCLETLDQPSTSSGSTCIELLLEAATFAKLNQLEKAGLRLNDAIVAWPKSIENSQNWLQIRNGMLWIEQKDAMLKLRDSVSQALKESE
ncbi:MAG: protein kinase [Phycisphaerae bacterium]|nr:protein kinase [Phycisphaerales bacterium]